ncbi:acetate--CoA ligase family protein [bacterium]|nr:acetate--CoA ligase family protein [bacterium]
MLSFFFNPKSVAVIGASSNPDKLGYAVLRNLVESGYSKIGKVYPINPKSSEILGFPAYVSVTDVPDPIDMAVIVIPYPYVPDALRSCGEKGIKGVVIISAGFREAGREGVEREREVIRIAKEYGIRIIGPNVLGVLDTFTPINASFAADSPPQGPIAITSQSGALGTAILDWASAGSMGLSKFVSLGNKADVNEVDLLKEWSTDDNTKVILMYIEELTAGQEFLNEARRVSKIKPVVAIKSGVTQSGARAVSSHTGSLAGSEQAYHAAFQQAGVIRADTMESLFDTAIAFGYQPPLKGNNIAIITNAGGPGILATDALERNGLSLARFENVTIQTLEQTLPDAASAANPVDVLGDAKADRYKFALDTVAKDPNVDGLIVVLTPQAMTEIPETAKAVCEKAKEFDKPILACFMGEKRVAEGIKVLTQCHIPNYPFPSRAANAFRAMSEYQEILERPDPVFENFEADKQAVRNLFDRVRGEGRYSIGDSEAREVLTAYGLDIPQSELADTPAAAVEMANKIGYPVVLKIASPDILHKTDVGGVKVGIQNDEQMRDAFELMVYRAKRYLPEARIWGCLVQEMVPSGNLEVLVGVNRDPQFGPLVTFGLGGIYVETLKDVTFRIAPFSKLEAEAMLEEIRSKALLNGVRGAPPVDKVAIVDTLLRIGQLVQDFPEILELDINPLTVFTKGQGAIAIDMRLVLAKETEIGG